MEFVFASLMALMLGLAYLAAGRMPPDGLRFARARRHPVAVQFPRAMSPLAHWLKATAIVELSLTRAASMSACQEAATRQLEAADYALHLLLDDLAQVMNVGIASPLNGRSAHAPHATTATPAATALAA